LVVIERNNVPSSTSSEKLLFKPAIIVLLS
jgi:hypothetical protein